MGKPETFIIKLCILAGGAGMIWLGITYECSQEGRKHTSLSFWLLD
jgi:hypothetical protein